MSDGSAPARESLPAATRYDASIAAQLLYWIRLPPETRRLAAQQQDYRFEQVLPVPVESLHVVRTRLRDGGALLVGIEPAQLRSHLAGRQDVSADTWTLLPDRLPAHLAASVPASALAGLNLLQGEFEPVRRRRVRQRRDLAAGVALALVLALALVGIERRVAAQTLAGEALRRSGQDLLAKTLGPSTGRLPHAALLTQELRRLEAAAHGPTATPVDAASILQRLWAAWPTEVRTQLETISLTADRLVIRGSVPTLADAERVAKASPTITAGETVFTAAPLQAELTARGAVFLLTWHVQTAGRKGGRR